MQSSVNGGTRARCRALSLALVQEDQLPSICSYRLTERSRIHGVMVLVQRPASITYSQ